MDFKFCQTGNIRTMSFNPRLHQLGSSKSNQTLQASEPSRKFDFAAVP